MGEMDIRDMPPITRAVLRSWLASSLADAAEDYTTRPRYDGSGSGTDTPRPDPARAILERIVDAAWGPADKRWDIYCDLRTTLDDVVWLERPWSPEGRAMVADAVEAMREEARR